MEDLEGVDAGFFKVDEDYLTNMNLKLVAGKFFNADHGSSNKSFVVVNEAAVKKLNFKTNQEAIGEPVIFMNDSTSKTIIGVVRDYNHRDLTRAISPVLLLHDPSAFNVMQVAYLGTFANASRSVEKAWASVNPGLKADYTEVESEINKFYDIVFGDLVKVLGFISFLAIVISCLGLLGMATYATETRIKEISIRKVLGSSGAALVLLLSKGFMNMLGIAIILGVPLAYFVNNLWLNFIAYRTEVNIGVIAFGVLVLAFFGIVTIGSQTLRATLVKPVENLKNE
jgi:putative ABC transport system permease protein